MHLYSINDLIFLNSIEDLRNIADTSLVVFLKINNNQYGFYIYDNTIMQDNYPDIIKSNVLLGGWKKVEANISQNIIEIVPKVASINNSHDNYKLLIADSNNNIYVLRHGVSENYYDKQISNEAYFQNIGAVKRIYVSLNGSGDLSGKDNNNRMPIDNLLSYINDGEFMYTNNEIEIDLDIEANQNDAFRLDFSNINNLTLFITNRKIALEINLTNITFCKIKKVNNIIQTRNDFSSITLNLNNGFYIIDEIDGQNINISINNSIVLTKNDNLNQNGVNYFLSNSNKNATIVDLISIKNISNIFGNPSAYSKYPFFIINQDNKFMLYKKYKINDLISQLINANILNNNEIIVLNSEYIATIFDIVPIINSNLNLNLMQSGNDYNYVVAPNSTFILKTSLPFNTYLFGIYIRLSKSLNVFINNNQISNNGTIYYFSIANNKNLYIRINNPNSSGNAFITHLEIYAFINHF